MIADLLRLVRAPLVATAIADGVAGYLLATVRVATEVGGHAPALLHDAPDPRPLAFVLVAATGGSTPSGRCRAARSRRGSRSASVSRSSPRESAPRGSEEASSREGSRSSSRSRCSPTPDR